MNTNNPINGAARMSRKRRRRDRKGASAVEFAVMAPIFALFVFGIIEFGRTMMVQQVLVNSSRVGARLASMPNQTTSSVVSAAEEYAEGASVTGVNVTVTPDPSTVTAGDLITVNVSVPFDQVSWLPSAWFMGGRQLESESVMRREGFE